MKKLKRYVCSHCKKKIAYKALYKDTGKRESYCSRCGKYSIKK